MSTTDEARAEAERRYPADSRTTGGSAQNRRTFIAGAEWQASRKVEVTEETAVRLRAAIAMALSIIDRDVAALANLDPTELRAALSAALGGTPETRNTDPEPWIHATHGRAHMPFAGTGWRHEPRPEYDQLAAALGGVAQ